MDKIAEKQAQGLGAAGPVEASCEEEEKRLLMVELLKVPAECGKEATAGAVGTDAVVDAAEWHKSVSEFDLATVPVSDIDSNLAAGSRFALEAAAGLL